MSSLPQHGQTIIFSKVPTASYCTPGVAYRVERPTGKGSFRFINVEQGSSTCDQAWAVKQAEWVEA